MKACLLFVSLILMAACSKSSDPSPLPVVAIDSVEAITPTSARFALSIVAEGNTGVTAAGVAYDTLPNPTGYGSHTRIDAFGTGSFWLTVEDLQAGKMYYARPFATNATGTAYGKEQTFSTPLVPVAALDRPSIQFFDRVNPTPDELLVSSNISNIKAGALALSLGVLYGPDSALSYASSLKFESTITPPYAYPTIGYLLIGTEIPQTATYFRTYFRTDKGIVLSPAARYMP